MAVVLGTNAGFVTVAPTTDPAGTNFISDNRSNATMDTTSAGNKIVTELGWYCDGATEEANFEVGIYTDSGGTIPDVVVGSLSTTNAKGTTVGWKKVTGLSIALNGSTAYWIAVQLDNTSTITNSNSSAGGAGNSINTAAFTSLPSPWGAEQSGGTLAYSIYAKVEATPVSGSTDNMSIIGENIY